ncbi:MAG: hypothetical protein U9R44_02440 [Candidatus Omnitrophota bacterium]|nr:hypothetical protein [Candidatus Omnitrophota bacterium]
MGKVRVLMEKFLTPVETGGIDKRRKTRKIEQAMKIQFLIGMKNLGTLKNY